MGTTKSSTRGTRKSTTKRKIGKTATKSKSKSSRARATSSGASTTPATASFGGQQIY